MTLHISFSTLVPPILSPTKHSSKASPPGTPPSPITPPPTSEDAPSGSNVVVDARPPAPLSSSASRNSIFASSWSSSPDGKLAPPKPLALPLKLDGLDSSEGASLSRGSGRMGSWSSSTSRRTSNASSILPLNSPGLDSPRSSFTSERVPSTNVGGGWGGSSVDELGVIAAVKRPTTPLYEHPPSMPSGGQGGHRKQSSTSSSISSKTSSFFDTPTPSATPPPPDNPPPALFHQLESLPYSPTRTSHFASQQALRPLVASSPRPSTSSPLSPVPKHATPLTQPRPHPLASTSTLPPPPLAIRLPTSSQYLLGKGLRASVYLSAIQAKPSVKGKEREWSLAATKIPLEDDGEEGRDALCREAEVLAWLGKKRLGIVGLLGLIDLDDDDETRQGKVRVVRTTPSATRSSTPIGSRAKQQQMPPFETCTFDRSSEELVAAFGGDEADGLRRCRGRPVLVLECGSVFGTIDTLVKAHPELVTEQTWIRWVGVLASAGEWLEARGVVHRDIKPQNILLTSSLSPLLTDFGSSLLPYTTSSPTPPPITTGTTPYSSPELLLYPETVSYPSDVFSLGATLYVAITGKEPFKGVSGSREMVFWVGKGGFWEWEERRRAAAWGGEVGMRRGGSLREHGHAAKEHTAPAMTVHGVPGRLVADGSGVGGEPKRVGSWECLRAKGEQGWGWTKDASAATLTTSGLPISSSARLRASLEESLLVLDDSSPISATHSPHRSPLLSHLLSPTFAPLSLPPTTTVPPSSPPASPPNSSPISRTSEDEPVLPPMEGVPMFFPSSTPYHPHQVSDSARRLLKRMVDPRAERRGTMREVREWAERWGWEGDRE